MQIKLLISAVWVANGVLFVPQTMGQQNARSFPPAPISSAKVASISFQEFFKPTDRDLQPTDKLMSLRGQRVRLVGYMAQMEDPPKGAFYLVPQPIFSDESGGGTADLPPQSVLVVVPSAKDKTLNFIARPVIVTGILDLGDASGVSTDNARIRLIMDRSSPRRTAPHRRPAIRKGIRH